MLGVTLLSGLGAAFSGFNYFGGAAAAQPGQTLCVVSNVPDRCKEGQLSWFAPDSWGNDQLPLKFAAFSCDYRYPIVWNNGGVSCIYTNLRRERRVEMGTPPPAGSAATQ